MGDPGVISTYCPCSITTSPDSVVAIARWLLLLKHNKSFSVHLLPQASNLFLQRFSPTVHILTLLKYQRRKAPYCKHPNLAIPSIIPKVFLPTPACRAKSNPRHTSQAHCLLHPKLCISQVQQTASTATTTMPFPYRRPVTAHPPGSGVAIDGHGIHRSPFRLHLRHRMSGVLHRRPTNVTVSSGGTPSFRRGWGLRRHGGPRVVT